MQPLDQQTQEYWAQQSALLDWQHPWTILSQGDMPHTRWFEDGQLNACVNCVDRHVTDGRAEKIAIIWEAEDTTTRHITYKELFALVQTCAQQLVSLGVRKGDRVTIYMGLVPEAVVAMLACARIGAIHNVVFGGFGVESLAKRIQDMESKVVVTCDSSYYRGNVIPLKKNVDRALAECPSVTAVIVVPRVRMNETPMQDGRDHWWGAVPATVKTVDPEPMNAEDTLFVLHTSGTTGKPKGIVHSTGGYLVGAVSSFNHVFQPQKNDVYWCTADVGWITGHSYVVYGPLALGATILLYEGALDWPKPDRIWEICAKYGVTILYTAPTAIRAFMRHGDALPHNHNLSTLRLLGSVGEPLNPEAWEWYYHIIGGGRCAIMDTWWQTETGMILLAPDKTQPQKPGSVGKPLPGVSVILKDDTLFIDQPWPSILRGIWRDEERFLETCFSQLPNAYCTHDRCRVDNDGDHWMLGRTDDVIIVAGHNLSTAEIESALTRFPGVTEAAVIGAPDPISGQHLVGFVVLATATVADTTTIENIQAHISATIGPIARPKRLFLVPDLPKTRSGKILRRVLRNLVEGKTASDMTTLANPEILPILSSVILPPT
ncbi:MAG: acetate--CoA ligase [Patescibacteria group bacterium]